MWFSTNFPAVSKLTESSQLPVKWPLRRGCISRDDKNRISFLGVFAVSSFNSFIALACPTTRKFSPLIFFYASLSFFLSFATNQRLLFNSIVNSIAQIKIFSFFILFSFISLFRIVIIEYNDRGEKGK